MTLPLRVLVTRPEPGAAATAQALLRRGVTPLVLPFSAVTPVEVIPPLAGAFDAVAATSANALRHAPSALLASLAALPLYAVGAATEHAARRAGFADTRAGQGGATALADRLSLERPGARVLYLCGRVRRPLFEERLRARGVAVTAAETYDTVARDPSDSELASLAPLDATLLTSVTGAVVFRRALARTQALRAAQAIALAPRIAEAAGQACLVAARPDERALLDRLTEWARSRPQAGSD